MVLTLDDDRSTSPELVGAKAANLARVARAGLPTLPGFVITTGATELGMADPVVDAAVRAAFATLPAGALVVRSSSTIEDAEESSLAGRFVSILDVVGWTAFVEAVRTVIDSAARVPQAGGRPGPMAVLVQRQLDARIGGVMFGADPLTGRRDRIVVELVAGGPDPLVSGVAVASRFALNRRGRIVERPGRRDERDPATLSRPVARRLAAVARAAETCFARPQDVEWAVDRGGDLWVLQSRAVTAVADTRDAGPLLGPGPVSETFPDPLSPLEQDLWIGPLREGIERALRVSGAVGARRLAASPVVTTVGGRAVVDLDLFGLTAHHVPVRRRVRPTAIARRLVAAWRVGRLRVALPALAHRVVDQVDAHLSAIGPLGELTDHELEELLDRGRRELTTVQCDEVLAGMLLAETTTAPSVARAALDALAQGHADGLPDAAITARDPVVLALSPPTLRPAPGLPAGQGLPGGSVDVGALAPRDALRLRSRWLQELLARTAEEWCVRRMAEHPDLTLEDLELRAMDQLRAWAASPSGTPLPPPATFDRAAATQARVPGAFRLTSSGIVLAAVPISADAVRGQPASAGRAHGTVRHRMTPAAGRGPWVLVTRHLDPGLAPLLPEVAGIVAETGSSLSHLAILARELGIPAVVGAVGAVERLPLGTHVVVDGTVGAVDRVADATGTEVTP